MQVILTAIVSVEAIDAACIRIICSITVVYAFWRHTQFVDDYLHMTYRDRVVHWTMMTAAMTTSVTLLAYLLPVNDSTIQYVVGSSAVLMFATMVRYGHWLQWNLHREQIVSNKNRFQYRADVPSHGAVFATASCILAGYIAGLVVYRIFVVSVSAALVPVLYFSVYCLVAYSKVPALIKPANSWRRS